MSLLFDGTLETGRSILDRGTRFTGSIIESFGMVNVADSLTAIKKLVYDEQRLSLEQLVVVLDNGFEGYADIHALCLEAPKYGNDMEAADVMLARVSGHACDHAMKLAPELGFDYFLLVNITTGTMLNSERQRPPPRTAGSTADRLPMAIRPLPAWTGRGSQPCFPPWRGFPRTIMPGTPTT
jgi:hypothetical protein